ncbi:hypothetical protein [Mycolicibacterium sediminis]|uniref:Uncharacterized protein n=1 Tax=Mycolicibacterium sediminis TaxID=1286180 RepID=A0A7I7QK80_9MYCO|nr:hypothetical protein [Mycolicibacterium sediminis]BBY26743.1 hypothetical protein MSEDJ_08390 [Mycolicibacterium sediminis]
MPMGDITDQAILEPAWRHLVAALGKPARLRVRSVTEVGHVAFLYCTILGDDGRLIDYTGTPFEEAAAHHARSTTYAVLLRREGTRWWVVDSAVGPTDLAWQGWAREHGVPPSLFDLSDQGGER